MVSNIRIAELRDLDNLLKLIFQLSAKKAEDENTSRVILERTLGGMLKNKDYVVAVYEQDNKLIGTATLIVQLNLSHGGRPYGHIENVVTDITYRGKGIGAQLVGFLVKKAKEVKCYKVILNCSVDNVPFYEKCSFHKTGEVEMRIDI